MAWTTPVVYTVGQLLTAATLNAQLTGNLNHLSTHAHSGSAGDGSLLAYADEYLLWLGVWG